VHDISSRWFIKPFKGNRVQQGLNANWAHGQRHRLLLRRHVFRNTKPAPGTNGPLIPGDPEREAEAIRSKEGIPLIKPVVDDLLDISKKTGIPFEQSDAL
jgi:LDH2 family malate/lactate/ureidoglycolate dehydrogenase